MKEVTLADIQQAAERLRGIAHATPVLTSRRLDDAAGTTVWLKCENIQRAA